MTPQPRFPRLQVATFTLALAIGILAPIARADDTAFFTASVPPNVMLLVDNSGSMNNLVWHPAFKPTEDPTCTTEWGFGAADNDATYSFSDTFTTTQCENERTLYADDTISGYTRISGRYLNWYFSDEASAYFKGESNDDEDNMDSLANGQRSACLVAEGLPATYSRYRRSRITAAQEVLREVVCQVNAAGQVRFGLSQFYDDSDPQGGWVTVPIEDYSDAHGAKIETFIDDLTADTWTPLAETLYNVYRYFQSRDNPIDGEDGNPFPAYDIELDGDVATPGDPDVPPSPVQYACQKNFVVIITDGEPTMDDFDGMAGNFFNLVGDFNPDNTNPEAGDETPASCSFCEETAFYLDDLAKYMHEHDFQEDVAENQTIDVYTIGFTTGGPANALLEKTANVANGFFRQSNNAEELAAVIIDQIVDIIKKSQSFTSATVPASRTTDGDNFYTSYFRPRNATPYWDGHLKNFKFTQTGDILTGNDTCAIGDPTASPPCPTEGVLQTSADGVWDAAAGIPAPVSRKLYVGAGATGYSARPPAWFSESGGAVTHTMTRTTLALPVHPQPSGDTPALTGAPYGLSDPYTTADLDALVPVLVSNVSGCNYGTLLGGDCVTRTNEDGDASLLGDIFHSNPVVVGSPNAAINDPAYKLFAGDHRDRKRVIYAGANDGWLRGILSGVWQTQDEFSQPLVPPRHDRGTGEELFGFMPSEIRENIWRLPGSQPAGTVRTMTTVDGSPQAADVWLYRDVDGSGDLTSLLSPPTALSKHKEQWRTVLIGGLRDGGRSYYALDVTDPDDSDYPGYLWEFPCDDCGNAINARSRQPIAATPVGLPTPADYLGTTWSEPVITRVRVRVEGDSDPRGHERWVAVVGGGYDGCGDPNVATYWQTAFAEACSVLASDKRFLRGRAILMIDITTGELLALKAHTPVAFSHPDGGQVGYPELQYAIPSQPAVFDLDFDGFADVIYIGDLGGNVWKWVVTAVGDDPINNSTTDNGLGQPDWPFHLFFHGAHSSEPGAATATTHFQSLFFPPTGVLRQGKLVLAFGAGERAALANGALDTLASNNNHYYVVKDTDPYLQGGSPTTITEADLVDIGLVDDGTLACSDIDNAKGYYLTGRDREKFVTNSVVFLGDVITGSFVPAPPGADACSASGTAYVYRFALDCADGRYPSNPGTPDDKRREQVGGGLPTRPRVSVGDLNQGGGGGGCNNKVVVITSDGEIDNDCPGSPPSSGVGIRTWKER